MYPSKKRRVATLAAAGALAVAAAAVSLMADLPASAATICEQFGTVDAGNYVIMNNRWGTNATHCINTTANGFTITQQDGTGNLSGAPVSYPAIYLGCHYSRCSPSTALPRQISTIGSAPSSLSVSYPGGGTWDAAFDIWMNVDNNTTGVQDTEIMIWLNRQGSIQPIGSAGPTVNIAGRGWQVWQGSNGQNNVVSYLFQGSPLTSFSFDVMDFVRDTFSRGSQYGNNNWWLTSVQAGFEPWIGGVGLTVNSFSQTINGGQTNQPPGTPGAPSCTTTSNSVSLNWGASSGQVSQYLVDRATGAGSNSFQQIGTTTGTSLVDGGRSASTTYRYRVRAQNSAGTSPFSSIVDCVTQGTGTQPPGTPGNPVCQPQSLAISLTWSASSGTVTRYLLERATGANSTSFTQVATPATNATVDNGLSANTTYRYRVRAENSAGTSAFSGITTCATSGSQTTSSPPPPPGGCSGTYTQINAWSGGYQGQITVRNTSSARSPVGA